MCRHERGITRDAEEEVLASFGFPGVASLSFAAGLIFGRQHEKFLALAVLVVADGVVGRVGLVNADNLEMV